MKNEKVIEKFLERESAKTGLRTIVNGYYEYQGRTLQTDGNKLINYSTIIAYFENDTLYLNTKKYSVTTSKIQNTIRRLASGKGLTIVEYVGE
jgi:hypothetical protein